MNGEKHLVRIVAPEPTGGGLTKTQGTRVFAGQVEITGITKIELSCDLNDVWRGTITMMVQPPADLSALAMFHRPSLWQRFKRWLHAHPATGGGPR